MIEKEFVPYEEALALKELGFDEPCLAYFIELRNPSEGILTIDKCENNIDGVLAPTFSQAFKFFREKGYDIVFRKMDYGVESNFTGYYYTIYNGNEMIDIHGADKRTKTYEEAELACLRKLIKIVKNQ